MTLPLVGGEPFQFQFDDDWYDGDHHKGATDGWGHHGVAVTSSGEVITCDEKSPTIQIIGKDGRLVRTFDAPITEAHGLATSVEGPEEFLWIADTASKNRRQADGRYAPDPKPWRGAVVKCRLDGTEVMRLDPPDLSMYDSGDFCPGLVAVDEERFGGAGDVWVADCYGQGVVHRFDKHGTLLVTLTGEEGAGRYVHPHGIHIDRRKRNPELYVADRGNRRVHVYDLDGGYVRSFGEEFLVSPSGFAPYGDRLLIAELDSRIAVLDCGDELVTYLGEYDPAARSRPGWPNVARAGVPQRPPLPSGAFNTPHGVAVDAGGAIYVSEWLIGGRLVKLTPCDPAR